MLQIIITRTEILILFGDSGFDPLVNRILIVTKSLNIRKRGENSVSLQQLISVFRK